MELGEPDKPDKPDKPDEPDKPDKPDKPEEPDEPDGLTPPSTPFRLPVLDRSKSQAAIIHAQQDPDSHLSSRRGLAYWL